MGARNVGRYHAPMAPRPGIADLRGETLRWTQPHTFSQEYELRSDPEVVATLEFRNMFGSLATGESADGCWTFKRLGFISTHVSIRACGSTDNLAIFRNSTWSGGGTLELGDGRRYLANSNFWQTRYQIRTEHETPLITFDQVGGLLHLSSHVEIHDPARSLHELPWMIMLGWYLTVMQHNDSAAVIG